MNILLLGSGGREHALAWKIAQSPLCEKLYSAPGNPGTAKHGENVSLETSDHAAVIAFCKEAHIGLVVVGPDALLAEGIVDALVKADIMTFGPTQAAAKIEWSKAYAKELMHEAGIPTAASQTFTDFERARAYVEAHPLPLVVKASGLAFGKGVIVAESSEEAIQALQDVMLDGKFGTAGNEVVIEEYLEGTEVSVHAFVAETDALLFPPAMDHKRAYDGDQGPNTGGMGTIAPVPYVTAATMEEIRTRIILPVLALLQKRGTPFRGLLFPGIMLTEAGPKVIEFNARFGDPETQSYLQLLESDIVPLLYACAKGSLSGMTLTWYPGAAACVTLAARGYPDTYERGKVITGIDLAEEESDTVVFHAGTRIDDGTLVTSGGRVLGVGARRATLAEALDVAYRGVDHITFEGKQFRTDIGARALNGS